MYFRRRLSRSSDPQRVFTAVRAVVAETGVLKGKVRRALDSTVLDDAVATQDTVTQLISAVRRVAREVSGAAEIVTLACTGHDYADPGKPKIAWNDEQARTELIDALVSDAIRLLAALPEREHGPKATDALVLLALVAGQDVEPADGCDGRDGRWRITRGTAENRVLSTVDARARHVHKTRSHKQDGYKAHLAVEPETGITPPSRSAPAPRSNTTGPTPPPTYSNTRSQSFAYSVIPLAAPRSWVPTCTNAATPRSSSHRRSSRLPHRHRRQHRHLPGRPHRDRRTPPPRRPARRRVQQSVRRLPAQGPLTRAKTGCQVRIRPDHDDLEHARRQATDPDWQAEYRRWRPPVERAVARLVAGVNRRLRYRGAIATNAWIHTRAAAVNLRTLINLGLNRVEGHWSLATPA